MEISNRSTGWALLPVLDRDQLLVATGGDGEFAAELLQAYLSSLPETMQEMVTAAIAGKLDEFRYLARQARDGSQVVGAQRVAAICLCQERLASLKEAARWLKAMNEEFHQFRALANSEGLVLPRAA